MANEIFGRPFRPCPLLLAILLNQIAFRHGAKIMITGYYLRQKIKSGWRDFDVFDNEEQLYRKIEQLRDAGISDNDLQAYYTTRKNLPLSDYRRKNQGAVSIGGNAQGAVIVTGNGNTW
jgi:hypothetical protein